MEKSYKQMPWFEQMFLSWVGCPADEGEFETGCHTAAGNELVLYIENTKVLNKRTHELFYSMWGYFSTKRWCRRWGGDEPLIQPEGIPDDLRYDILKAGPRVPTYVGTYSWPIVKRLYKEALVMYEKECGQSLPEIDDNTIRDLQNYLLRRFNVWLNETKRYKQI
jgi:hypothetical protein